MDCHIFQFLSERECHLMETESGTDGWVSISFKDLEALTTVFGESLFKAGGLEATIMDGYISIDFSSLGMDVKKCSGIFPEEEWADYFGEEDLT